jgi:hypothetical protein
MARPSFTNRKEFKPPWFKLLAQVFFASNMKLFLNFAGVFSHK